MGLIYEVIEEANQFIITKNNEGICFFHKKHAVNLLSRKIKEIEKKHGKAYIRDYRK